MANSCWDDPVYTLHTAIIYNHLRFSQCFTGAKVEWDKQKDLIIMWQWTLHTVCDIYCSAGSHGFVFLPLHFLFNLILPYKPSFFLFLSLLYFLFSFTVTPTPPFPVLPLNLCAPHCPLFLWPLSGFTLVSLVHLGLFLALVSPFIFLLSFCRRVPFFFCVLLPLTFEGEWGSTQLTRRGVMTSRQTWYTSVCSGLKIPTTGHTQSVCSCTQCVFSPPRNTETAQLLHNWGLWACRVSCCWTTAEQVWCAIKL